MDGVYGSSIGLNRRKSAPYFNKCLPTDSLNVSTRFHCRCLPRVVNSNVSGQYAAPKQNATSTLLAPTPERPCSCARLTGTAPSKPSSCCATAESEVL